MKELVNKWRGDMRIAVMLAAGISLYCFFTNALTLNASHEDKIFGSYGIFRQLSIALSFPSVVVVRAWEHGAGNVLSNDDLWHFLCLNMFSYTLLFFVCLRLYRWWTSLPNDPVSKRRRYLLLGAVAGAGAVGSGFYLRKDIDTVEVVRQPLPLPNLHPSLQGLKLVLMADWHRGPFIGMDYLDKVAQLCNAEKPDIVCIAGDFVYEDAKYFADVNIVLKRLDVSAALLGTLGNHDHWQGGMPVAQAALASSGLRFLDNRHLYITPQRTVSDEAVPGALCIAGVGDSWEDNVDFQAALCGVPEELPRILLAHNPDVAESPDAGSWRTDVLLAGHTHGGQVSLPLLGTVLVTTKYGDKYVAGWAQGPHFPVYTNRGIGMTVLPIRSGARPEITVFTLEERKNNV